MELCEVRLNEIMEAGTVSIQAGTDTVAVLADPERKELCILAAIGVPPEEGAGQFDRQLLEEDFRLASSGEASLSFDSDSGRYMVVRTLSSVGLDDEALRKIIADLDGMRNAWRARLTAIRPAQDVDGMMAGEGFIRG